MSWDTSEPTEDFGWNGGTSAGDTNGGGEWNGGGASLVDSNGGDEPYGNSAEQVSKHAGADDDACRNCGQVGHFKRDCPEPSQNSGECYNCGEIGHNKADCTNPAVERPFTGQCRTCGEEGHRGSECPKANCNKCGKDGHTSSKCENAYNIFPDNLPLIKDADVAWEELVKADEARDAEEFKLAFLAYAKLCPSLTFPDLETSFREQDFNTYLIALEREAPSGVYTNVDLQGTPGHKYVLSFQRTTVPRRQKGAEAWPKTVQDNLERLKDAGFPMDAVVVKCRNCNVIGHVKRDCPEPAAEPEKLDIVCKNCHANGHYVRDCTEPRVDRNACKNCGDSGHHSKECPEPRKAGDDVQCNHCQEMGHFSRDCPSKPAMTCRNCGEEGHKSFDCTNERVITCRNCNKTGHVARECEEPRNMDNVQCRNCDAHGHFSKDCPEPKNWSKVQCRNCSEFGHGAGRCTNPPKEEEAVDAPSFDANADGADTYTTTAATGDWDSVPATDFGVANGAVSGGDWGPGSAEAVVSW